MYSPFRENITRVVNSNAMSVSGLAHGTKLWSYHARPFSRIDTVRVTNPARKPHRFRVNRNPRHRPVRLFQAHRNPATSAAGLQRDRGRKFLRAKWRTIFAQCRFPQQKLWRLPQAGVIMAPRAAGRT